MLFLDNAAFSSLNRSKAKMCFMTIFVSTCWKWSIKEILEVFRSQRLQSSTITSICWIQSHLVFCEVPRKPSGNQISWYWAYGKNGLGPRGLSSPKTLWTLNLWGWALLHLHHLLFPKLFWLSLDSLKIASLTMDLGVQLWGGGCFFFFLPLSLGSFLCLAPALKEPSGSLQDQSGIGFGL